MLKAPYAYTHLFYFYTFMGVQLAWIWLAEQDPISRLWSERTSILNETAVTRSFTAFEMRAQSANSGRDGEIWLCRSGTTMLCPLKSGSSPVYVCEYKEILMVCDGACLNTSVLHDTSTSCFIYRHLRNPTANTYSRGVCKRVSPRQTASILCPSFAISVSTQKPVRPAGYRL